MKTRKRWQCQRRKTKGCSVDELPAVPPVMDFTASTFASEHKPFSLSLLPPPALLIPPSLLHSPAPAISFHLPVAAL